MSYGDKGIAYHKSPERKGASPRRMRRRMPQRATYVLLSIALIALFYYIHRSPSTPAIEDTSLGQSAGSLAVEPEPKSQFKSTTDVPPCRNLPGAEDVLVVMKTGSTEMADKLPVHFNTTLRCYPQYMIFSDYEETYQGEQILDALKWTTPKIQQENGDFELWRRLQKGGRAALKGSELSGPVSRPQATNGGKPSNPGWKLDKWKFLPMVNMTYNAYPDKKWYMFVETDTYVFWQTVLNYMDALDPKKPWYVGGQAWIGDVQFNHGGTGFIASQSAVASVVKLFNDHKEEWETFTEKHWAGDCVLGKAMKEAGAPPVAAWPIWQGDDVGKMDWWRVSGVKRLWCAAANSWHHVSPTVVESLWEFEQDYILRTKDPKKYPRYSDIFYEYTLPRVQEEKMDWDNHADEDQGPIGSMAECRAVCEKDKECVQYMMTSDMRCATTKKSNLGEWSRGMESGWLPDRMKKWAERMDKTSCAGNTWIT